jgi:hypothetical protein
MLGFPRGIRTLVAPEPYEHGGISLQECVIPHIVAMASMPIVRIRPQLAVTQSTLTGGTVPYILRIDSTQQAPLGGLQARRVLIALETSGASPVHLLEREEELSEAVPEVRSALFLPEGRKLPAGSGLELKCLDRETGEQLAVVPLTLAVAWD